MTKIKFCGLSRPDDIDAANKLKPAYIGFVFVTESKRCVTAETAVKLKQRLSREVQAVGVFADEMPEKIAEIANDGVIDMVQLHGNEDEEYLHELRKQISVPIIRAFQIKTEEDAQKAGNSTADYILLDSGAGTGKVFDWTRIQRIRRPYFLAGGLNCDNAEQAVRNLHPFAVDVSSGIETGAWKDQEKMAAFAAAVRKGENA